MNIQNLSVRSRLLPIALTFLFAGAASAFAGPAALSEYTFPDRSAAPAVTYRGLDYGFDASPVRTEAILAAAALRSDDPSCPSTTLAARGKAFFPELIGGTGRIFSSDNLKLAAIGTGLAVLAVTIDHRSKNYFQNRRPLDGVSIYGDTIGQGYYHVAVGGALIAVGELSNNPKLSETGVVALQALLVNGIATEVLKYASDRLRPNGGDHMSFPSGHASSTATLAASISEMYDWRPAVSIPLFATVAFVGASRIQDNMHYLSDVLAGVTLGTLIGTSFAKYHKESSCEERSARMSFTPLLDKDLKGGLFTMKW